MTDEHRSFRRKSWEGSASPAAAAEESDARRPLAAAADAAGAAGDRTGRPPARTDIAELQARVGELEREIVRLRSALDEARRGADAPGRRGLVRAEPASAEDEALRRADLLEEENETLSAALVLAGKQVSEQARRIAMAGRRHRELEREIERVRREAKLDAQRLAARSGDRERREQELEAEVARLHREVASRERLITSIHGTALWRLRERARALFGRG